MTVHFEQVGCDKLSWDAEMEVLSERALSAAIRKRKALATRNLDFNMEIEGAVTVGQIFAGFRQVGTFRIEGGLSLKPMVWQ